jgi:membrane associated rhomboid family serine protease
MLIIPLTGKISKKNPPVITIGIILINCFVFFVLQAGERHWHSQATQFYVESGLAKIEVSRYLAYVRVTKSEESELPLEEQEELDEAAIMSHHAKMQSDEVFMEKLLNGEIVKPEDQTYPTWKSLRTKYENKLSRVVSIRYGFKPADRSVLTAFTHMFLHGSFMHILGNMVFLWLVGCVLELGCGRVVYVAIYLVSGILAVGLFFLVYMNSRIPLIGASGAIAGLMGAYTVLYGTKKIRVFYSVGFYFNYARVSGIILLPLWIGNEIFQLFFGSCSQIAYVAHIGGLTSGASLGYVSLRLLRRVDEELFAEDPKEKIPSILEKALERMGELDMDGARSLLQEALAIDPNNRDALTHLFNVDKLDPQGERFHKTASKLLLRLSRDRKGHEVLYSTYNEYCRISRRPRFSLNLLFRISSIFSAQGHLKESEKIMALLMRKNPKFQKLPGGILNLARAYLTMGMGEKGKECLKIICQRYPESSESQIARRLFKG